MKVVFAGGGTGGHVYPGIAIARELLERDRRTEAVFIGTRRGLEVDVVPREGFRLALIDVAGFRRRLSPDTLLTAFRACKGLVQAIAVLRRERPDVVVGTGGYVSGPVVLAAWLLGVPTLIHEQNALPGVTTRVLSRIANVVALTFEESAACLGRARSRAVVTGNPVRRSILEATRQEGARSLGLDPGLRTVLVFGGSQGARAINEAFYEALEGIMQRRDVQVVFQTGRQDHASIVNRLQARHLPASARSRLVVAPYLYEMDKALACADLTVSRAGAISIAEITARGLPCVLIPYPTAAEGHQERNARALERAGAAVVILQRDLSAGRLLEVVRDLLDEPARLARMSEASRALGRPEAAAALADIVEGLLR